MNWEVLEIEKFEMWKNDEIRCNLQNICEYLTFIPQKVKVFFCKGLANCNCFHNAIFGHTGCRSIFVQEES